LKTQEKQLEILFCSPKDLSYREIGRKVGCDPRTAKKYIQHPELIGKPRQTRPRPSLVDAYHDQIDAFLNDVEGNHRASWIYDQLVKIGFTGGYEIVKRRVRQLKGRKQQLAYVRFETMPGEQAQVDFGEFMVAQPDGTSKKYYLFAMILGYSRKLFACLLERCDLPNFLEAHILAFEHLGGVPQEVLYDRMRNVYIRDVCGARADGDLPGVSRPMFTQSLVTLAVHYGFAPRVAPAYAAWVKGKIERPMDFVRESWWCGYGFSDLHTANTDLAEWLALKEQRVHGTTHERVDARFEREKPHLHALPPHRCDVSLRLTRPVHKDCTISVDGNRYVVAHTLVGREVTVRLKDRHLNAHEGATPDCRVLRIFADADLVVEYDVPKGKGHLVQDPRFYEALRADRELQERKFANKGKGKKKGRARFKRTISPTTPRYPVVVEPIVCAPSSIPALLVERRSMDVYACLGGEVAHG
jgi:transposase